jgi:hypothetical protein
MPTKFWSENLKGRNYAEDLGIGGRVLVDCVLGKYCGKV